MKSWCWLFRLQKYNSCDIGESSIRAVVPLDSHTTLFVKLTPPLLIFHGTTAERCLTSWSWRLASRSGENRWQDTSSGLLVRWASSKFWCWRILGSDGSLIRWSKLFYKGGTEGGRSVGLMGTPDFTLAWDHAETSFKQFSIIFWRVKVISGTNMCTSNHTNSRISQGSICCICSVLLFKVPDFSWEHLCFLPLWYLWNNSVR